MKFFLKKSILIFYPTLLQFISVNRDLVLFNTRAFPAVISDNIPWKILIVDDEPAIHLVTKLALSDFVLDNKPIEFLSAHTENEAKKLMKETPDIALVLLDTIMETTHSGINLIKHIRTELQLRETRIVIRSGQLNHGLEDNFIMNYDIHDLKDKAELTVNRLKVSVISALRTYHHLQRLAQQQRWLDSNQLYARTMINHLSVMAITLDRKFQVGLWSKEAEHRTGVLAADIEGCCLWAKTDFFDPVKELLEETLSLMKNAQLPGIHLKGRKILSADLMIHMMETSQDQAFLLILHKITDSPLENTLKQ